MKSLTSSSITGRIIRVFLTAAIFLCPIYGAAQTEDHFIVISPSDDKHIIGVALPPQVKEKHDRNLESIDTAGFIDRPEQVRRSEYVTERIELRRNLARERHSATGSRLDDPDLLGYFDLGAAPHGHPHLSNHRFRFYPTIVPGKFLKRNSKTYVVPGGTRIKQVHTDTDFGTLIVDEFVNSTTNLYNTNLVIDGNDAFLTRIRYKEHQWATILYAPVGSRLFVLECNRNLSAQETESFVELARQLIANAL